MPLQTLIFLAFIPVVLSAIAGLIRFKKLEPPLHILFWLIIVAVVTEVVSRVLWVQKISNLFLWPMYISAEFALIAWLYRYELKKMFLAKIIPVLAISFTAFTCITWLMGKSAIFQPLQRFIESIFVLSFVLMFFYQTIKDMAIVHLERMPMFWVSAGLFIYFTGDIFIFIFSNYILSYSKQFNMQTWAIHAVFNTVLYIFYTLALCINPKK